MCQELVSILSHTHRTCPNIIIHKGGDKTHEWCYSNDEIP